MGILLHICLENFGISVANLTFYSKNGVCFKYREEWLLRFVIFASMWLFKQSFIDVWNYISKIMSVIISYEIILQHTSLVTLKLLNFQFQTNLVFFRHVYILFWNLTATVVFWDIFSCQHLSWEDILSAQVIFHGADYNIKQSCIPKCNMDTSSNDD